VTLKELADELELVVLVGGDGLDREVTGGYCGDLLSDVMANAAPGQVWITIQGHLNVVAVGTLRELAGVILAADRQPADEMRVKADTEGLPVLCGRMSAFELAGRLHRLLEG
jgi:predicted transcriptional regulator